LLSRWILEEWHFDQYWRRRAERQDLESKRRMAFYSIFHTM
jgi:hypothetical protein